MREHNDDPFPVGCRVTEEHPKWGDGAPMLCGEEVWFRASEYTDDPNDSDSWWAAHIIMIHPDEITVGWVDEHGEEGTFEAHRSDLHRVRPLSAHLTRIDSEPDPADPESSAVAKAAPEGSDPGPTTGQALLGEPTSPLRGSSQHTTAPAPESSPDGEENERMVWFKRGRKSAEAQVAALTARLAAWPKVPDGQEVLVVPEWVSDEVAEWAGCNQLEAALADAGSAAVARRPKPEPRVERVDALYAIRERIELTHPEGEFLAVGVELREDGDLVAIEHQEPWGKAQPIADDGTVEVLAEDGES